MLLGLASPPSFCPYNFCDGVSKVVAAARISTIFGVFLATRSHNFVIFIIKVVVIELLHIHGGIAHLFNMGLQNFL